MNYSGYVIQCGVVLILAYFNFNLHYYYYLFEHSVNSCSTYMSRKKKKKNQRIQRINEQVQRIWRANILASQNDTFWPQNEHQIKKRFLSFCCG